ncbi:hypothetical protein ACLKA7_013564 [Drosophila subpalustris]
MTKRAIAAFDSEIVEAESPNRHLSATVNKPIVDVPNLEPNDLIMVKPYNILEANCPQGYVLANKHCHKRVRGAATMT